MTEPGESRAAAHVLLDALTAFDPEKGEHPDNDRAIKLALRRLEEVGAITMLVDDEAGTRTVDAQPLLQGALNLLIMLTYTLAEAKNTTPEQVTALLRDQLP